MCFMSLFKKKTPKTWTFGDMPVVKWYANVKSKYDLETVCKIILTEILHLPNIELQVVTNDRLVKKFDTKDVEMQALLDGYPAMHRYVLHLRGKLQIDILEIISHEMVHLKQYETGNLRLEGTTFIWKGQKYENTEYWDRPWEKEARNEQYNIEKQVKKLYYE